MKEWLKRIFYTPRHSKPTDENILRLLMPSVVGIFICMVCLAGSTWAWFSATVQTVPQTIEAASFDISAAVTDASGQPVPSGQLLEAQREQEKAELAAERERLEADRLQSQQLMAELQKLKKQLDEKQSGGDPSEPPAV